jgi:hypothetical protein
MSKITCSCLESIHCALPGKEEAIFIDTFLNCGSMLFVSGEYCRLQVFFLSVVGSLEEQWYLEIVDKGSVSCPTCQAVGRKTIEGLKKHMENCKQVRYFCDIS